MPSCNSACAPWSAQQRTNADRGGSLSRRFSTEARREGKAADGQMEGQQETGEDGLLSLSAKFLNAETELCRLFGAKTVRFGSHDLRWTRTSDTAQVAAQRKESASVKLKTKNLLIQPSANCTGFRITKRADQHN